MVPSISTEVVLPGDRIAQSALPTPQKSSRALTIGPGLHHDSGTISATVAGPLSTDGKKNAIWVESHGGRYIPQTNDLVIARILRSSGELYYCSLAPYSSPAVLGHLAFENVTRKTRPQLANGALVYARVAAVPRETEVELSCVSATTGKSEGLGPLKEGMLFQVSKGLARRLLLGDKGGVIVLSELGSRIGFEVCVGRNGAVWVDGETRVIVAVWTCLKDVDEKDLGVDEQRKLAAKVLQKLK